MDEIDQMGYLQPTVSDKESLRGLISKSFDNED